MRPFEHYRITGQSSVDYQVFMTDQQLYEQLSDRGEDLLAIAKDEFLGEYKVPPQSTLKELLESLTERRDRIKRIIELRMPEIILKAEEEKVTSLEEKIKNKDFINHTDKVALDYKRACVALSAAFLQSSKFKQTLKEIYKYNDEAANKIIDTSNDKKDERLMKWLNS
jgi:galactitol-specific phosphotransferase system IIB component